jgi:5-methylcytosine-specific restriction endonuclease McrA
LDGTTSKIGILQALNGKHIHGDHIKPHSKGGTTDIDNLQFLTKEDNLKKSDS